jgi:hypothetical protein
MLLLLRRKVRAVVTFCAFENIRKLTTAEKRRREQRPAFEKRELV